MIPPIDKQVISGSIVNISSIAGRNGIPGHVLYSASKGAVITMTKDTAYLPL